MAKNKTIVITIIETRHKTRPWTYTINKPGTGPMETKQERYSRIWTAKRGALRQLGDTSPEWTGMGVVLAMSKYGLTEHRVEWRIERLKTKTKKGKK